VALSKRPLTLVARGVWTVSYVKEPLTLPTPVVPEKLNVSGTARAREGNIAMRLIIRMRMPTL